VIATRHSGLFTRSVTAGDGGGTGRFEGTQIIVGKWSRRWVVNHNYTLYRWRNLHNKLQPFAAHATSRIKADPALRSIPIIAVTSYY
jgi:hypothetical protein